MRAASTLKGACSTTLHSLGNGGGLLLQPAAKKGSVATPRQILSAVFTSQVAIAPYAHWLLFATLGNVAGGVTFVTLLNFGQVKTEE